MKIYITKPRNHWISPYTILEKIFFWREIDYDEPLIEKWADRLEPFCKGWQKFLDYVHPEVRYVKIDYWDTWSMDHTLSHIILPMLIQLDKIKHGSPKVDDEDVPEELKSTSAPPKKEEYDIDDNWHKRWEWVMAEMIWTFTQLSDFDNEDKFYDHSKANKDEKDINKVIADFKWDKEGFDRHHNRIENGLRLFGKYYRGLWD